MYIKIKNIGKFEKNIRSRKLSVYTSPSLQTNLYLFTFLPQRPRHLIIFSVNGHYWAWYSYLHSPGIPTVRYVDWWCSHGAAEKRDGPHSTRRDSELWPVGRLYNLRQGTSAGACESEESGRKPPRADGDRWDGSTHGENALLIIQSISRCKVRMKITRADYFLPDHCQETRCLLEGIHFVVE